MVDLKRDLSQRRRHRPGHGSTTTDPDPSYLRIIVLDSFDGAAWRPSGREIPVKQRADGTVTAAARARPHGPRRKEVRRHRRGQRRVQLAVAADAVPGHLGERAGRLALRPDHAGLHQRGRRPDHGRAHLPAASRCELSPTAAELADAAAGAAVGSTRRTPRSRATSRARCGGWPRPSPSGQHIEVREGGGAAAVVPRRRRLPLLAAARRPATAPTTSCSSSAPARTAGSATASSSPPRWRVMGRSLGIPSRVAVGFLRPEQTAHRHLGLQLPRPARLAGDVLRRRRLGALRAHAADEHGRGPRRTRRSRCRRPAAPSASSSARRPHRPSNRPTGQDPGRRGDPEPATTSGSCERPASGVLGWVLLPLALAAAAAGPAHARARWSAVVAGPVPTTPRRWSRPAGASCATPRSTSASPWDDRVTLRTAAAALTALVRAVHRDPDDAAVRLPRRRVPTRPGGRRRRCTGWWACWSGPATPAACPGRDHARGGRASTWTRASPHCAPGVDRRHRVAARRWLPASLLYAVRARAAPPARDRGRLITRRPASTARSERSRVARVRDRRSSGQ